MSCRIADGQKNAKCYIVPECSKSTAHGGCRGVKGGGDIVVATLRPNEEVAVGRTRRQPRPTSRRPPGLTFVQGSGRRIEPYCQQMEVPGLVSILHLKDQGLRGTDAYPSRHTVRSAAKPQASYSVREGGRGCLASARSHGAAEGTSSLP